MSETSRPKSHPHVVIIGAGFGGLEAAKALSKTDLRVTLIDRSNHHLFQPLLYQVATAGLNPSEIAIPIRSVLRKSQNVRTIMATVTDISLENKTVTLEDGEVLRHDYLIVASGAGASYFGNDHWAEFAPPLKSIEDATKIRRNVLLAFERADRIARPDHRKRELTFVVIGGGPTGVELAGAFAELGQRVLADDFRTIAKDEPRILLIEGADRLLPGMSETSSAEAKRSLEELGVDVRLGMLAKDITAKGVQLGDELIEADTVVWAAGVAANPITKQLGVETDRGGRVIVNSDCSIPEHRHAFVVGDAAKFMTEEGKPLPGVSPVAMQQGRFVAKVIGALLSGEKPAETFKYFDKGSMATIGRSRAVAETAGFKLKGFPAWMAWLFVHLWFLVGFKNRIFVLLQWIFSYVMVRRGARLITGADREAEAQLMKDRLAAIPGLSGEAAAEAQITAKREEKEKNKETHAA